MLNRLVLETENYVYVYHTGTFPHPLYMGMTKDAYNSVKSSFKVSCFIRTSHSYEENKKEVEYEHSLGKDGAYPMGIKLKDSIACLDEFYKDALQDVFIDFKQSIYLIDRDSWLGVQLSGFDIVRYDLDMDFNYDAIKMGAAAIDFSNLANEYVMYGKRSDAFKTFLKTSYTGIKRYLAVEILEGTLKESKVSLISNFCSIDSLEKLNLNPKVSEMKVKYQYVLSEKSYICI